MKHGLNSKEFFVRDDEREEFDGLRETLAAEVAPQTPLDGSLFTQLLHTRAERSFFRALKELRVQMTNHTTRDNLPIPLSEEAPALVRRDDCPVGLRPSGMLEMVVPGLRPPAA